MTSHTYTGNVQGKLSPQSGMVLCQYQAVHLAHTCYRPATMTQRRQYTDKVNLTKALLHIHVIDFHKLFY